MNIVIVSGNLTRDPEMRYTPQGTAVTEFTVASNYGSGEKKTTEYLRIITWERLAETVAENARLGHKVLVQGRYMTDHWVDKSGTKRETVKIRATSVEFLTPKSGADRPTPPPQTTSAETDFSDLKF